MPDGGELLDSPAAGPAAVRGGVVRVAGYVLGVLLTTASAAVLFRHLGVEDAGRYVLAASVVALAVGVTDGGLGALGVRELAVRDVAASDALMRDLTGLRLVSAAAATVIAVAYVALVGQPSTVVAGTALVALAAVISGLQTIVATPLLARLHAGWVAAADLLRQVVTAVGIVVLAATGAGVLPFFAVLPVASAAGLAMTVAVVGTGASLRPSRPGPSWRWLLRETLPFALAVAVGTIYFRLAMLAVDLLADDHQTGLFGASFRIVEVLVLLPQLAIGTGLPILARAARDDPERLRYGLQRMLEASLLLGGVVAGGLAVGAAIAIDVVGGAEFQAATGVLRIQAAALFLAFVSVVPINGLLALRRYRSVLQVTSLGLLAGAVALAALVPDHGARGAALATVIGELVIATSAAITLRRAGVSLRPGLPKDLRAALRLP